MAYKKVLASNIRSSAVSEFSTSCERCGKPLKGKGSRGNALGHVLCKDCSSDKTWQLIASGALRFDDLQHEVA